MDEVKSKLIGGAIVLVLGGTGFTVSQSDIVNNFAQESGMTQQQAQQYVEESQDDLDSFGNIGTGFVESGNTVIGEAAGINCEEYVYEWETALLSCDEGKRQLHFLGSKEIDLGQCFKELDTDLGDFAEAKVSECIADIDELNLAYDQPAAANIFGADYVSETKNTNLFNKSVLRTALESE